MKKLLLLCLFMGFDFLYCQVDLKPGDEIYSGEIILVNGTSLSFYNLKYEGDEKVEFINAESKQPEFLYLSSIKSIEEGEVIEAEETAPVSYSIFDNKGESVSLQNPAPGKAVVYFVRTGGAGFLINFRYFDTDKFIGKFAGDGFLRYECDPGEHIFWVSSSNVNFIDADLKADEIYVIEVIPQMGVIYAAVKLDIPNRYTSKKKYERQRRRLLKILANPKNDKTPELIQTAEQHKHANEIIDSRAIYERREKRDANLTLLPIHYFR